MIRNVLLTSLFLYCCLVANGQDYLKIANDCFDKGDYECAKQNYTLFQTIDGRNMSAQIKNAEDCYRSLLIADEYFSDKDYEKARDRYKIVLDKNPKDPNARRKYDLCVTELTRFANYSETTNNLNIQMIAVQGGTFTMGCTAEQGDDCYDNEKPAHRVTVSDFYIGKCEITQAQWRAVMGSNPSYFKGDNLPVESVSWNDVQEFIRKLNSVTGKNYRLPTEAEWEFAARGGNNSRGYKFSGNNNVDIVGFHTGNSATTTHAVGTKSPNELGIYDMSGNVWEWCNDWYGSYTYNSNAQTNPQGSYSGSERVLRGGSCHREEITSRVSFRSSDPSDSYYDCLGFRLAHSSR